MDVSCTTFTLKEITALLADKGITEESADFYQERVRRFRTVDGRPGVYVENEGYLNEPSSSDSRRTEHQ